MPGSQSISTLEASRDLIATAQTSLVMAYFSVSLDALRMMGLRENRNRTTMLICDTDHLDRDDEIALTEIGVDVLRVKKLQATFHPKCIIADHNRALISSANASWSALTNNVEVGILIDGDIATELERTLMAFVKIIRRGER